MLESLEELLLVQGVTPQFLFGNDLNRNGVIDPEEDDGSGPNNLGLSAFLTVYSREQNSDSQGNAYFYLNSPDLQTLYQNLTTNVDPGLAAFIILGRQYGITSTPGSSSSGTSSGGTGTGASGGAAATAPAKVAIKTPAKTGGGAGAKGGAGNAGGNAGGANSSQPTGDLTSVTLDFTKQGKTQLTSMWQLINAQVTVPATPASAGTPATPAVTYASPLNDPSQLTTLLPLLFTTSTLYQGNEIPARININTAPYEVLSTLPELTSNYTDTTTIQNILSIRPPLAQMGQDPTYQTPTWLYTQANLPLSTLQLLDPYITTNSQVYRVQSVGYLDDGGPAARIEAIIDTNGGRPRLMAWRDLSRLGKGYNPQE